MLRSRHRPRGGAQVDEGTGGATGQPGNQLLELASLALPADPALFRLRPAPPPLQQQKAPRRFGVIGDRGCGRIFVRICTRASARNSARTFDFHRVLRLQSVDHQQRIGQQTGIAVGHLTVSVGKVGQNCELRMPFDVRQMMTL